MDTFKFKAITKETVDAYAEGQSALEQKTNIQGEVLQRLKNMAQAKKLAIILRPVNPIAFALMKKGAVGKNMFVHGKSAEQGLAKGLIPLRSSISKAGKANDIQNIQKYNSENQHSIMNSENAFKKIKSGQEVNKDKFEELVFPVKLLDKNDRQIFIFENKDDVALQDESGKHVYAIKDNGTFLLIDENHELIDNPSASQWLKDKIDNGYKEIEVEVFGKPKITNENGELKVEKVQPITADIDVLAYGYDLQVSGRRYSDVENFHTILEKVRRQVIENPDFNVQLDHEQKDNFIKHGIEEFLPKRVRDDLKSLEDNMTDLSGMGDGTEITHDFTDCMRSAFRNCEISHGPEQFNLRFPQPLDKEWICISNKETDEIEILDSEAKLVEAFNKFKKDGFNMLPNPHWAWKLENGKYVIDPKYKKMFNDVDKLVLNADKNVSQSQTEYIEHISNIKREFGIALATTKINVPSRYEQILSDAIDYNQDVINGITGVIKSSQPSMDELKKWAKNKYYETLVLHDAMFLGSVDMMRFLIEEQGINIDAKDQWGKTALDYAARLGNVDVMRCLKENGANIDAKDKSGRPIIHSVKSGKLIEWFIENGANINATDELGKTALHCAVERNNLGVVQLLLKGGAEVDAKDKSGKTALHYAVEPHNRDVVQSLLKDGAKVDATDEFGKTALHYAVVEPHNRDVVQSLLKGGAKVDAKDQWGQTALHKAARLGNVDMMRCLKENGANIDAKDKWGRPIIHSVKSGKLIEWFIENGANINATDELGKTALHYAVVEPHNRDVVQLLLKVGAEVDAKDKCGKTALHYAVEQKSNRDVVQSLLKGGAKVDATDELGKTASHKAVIAGNPDMVTFLKENGANINATDDFGKTTLHYAVVEPHNRDVVQSLLKVGAEVDAKDKCGKTALHYAVEQKSNRDVVQSLLKGGAKVDAKDKSGKTALDYAAIYNPDMLTFLIKQVPNNDIYDQKTQVTKQNKIKGNYFSK